MTTDTTETADKGKAKLGDDKPPAAADPTAEKKQAEPKRESKRGPGRPRRAPLETRLQDFLSVIASGFAATGDWTCATILSDRSEQLAGAWSRLAKRNKRINAALESLLSGGEWGEVVLVTALTVVPMAAHHGLVPAQLSALGLLTPDDAEHIADEIPGEPAHVPGEPMPAPGITPSRHVPFGSDDEAPGGNGTTN